MATFKPLSKATIGLIKSVETTFQMTKIKLFDALGGYDMLGKVHTIFYDKVYTHPWLSQFFEHHNQQFIEKQQTDFMAEKMGGPCKYRGKTPDYAHQHMYITPALFELRQQLLKYSIEEAGINAPLRKRWLRIDAAFKHQVANEDYDEFMSQYTYKTRVVLPNPKQEN